MYKLGPAVEEQGFGKLDKANKANLAYRRTKVEQGSHTRAKLSGHKWFCLGNRHVSTMLYPEF